MRIFDYEDHFQTFIRQNLEENAMWMIDRNSGDFTLNAMPGLLNALAYVYPDINAFLNLTGEQETVVGFCVNSRNYTLKLLNSEYIIQYNGAS